MSYIGRGTDKISNVEKLDNISFSGSTATFNLTKGGTAFIPSSAECIRLAIDGVEQGNNYTVSGSQITFDFTPSGSSTNNWIYHIGVGVITSPGDGTVTNAKIGADAVNGDKIADDSISDEHLDNTAITGQTAITSLQDTDKFLVSDASDSGNLKYVEKQYLGGGLDNWSESSGNLLPSNASYGIYLGVNSATASNLLDDFEEGTYTYAITSANGGTVSNRSGYDKLAYTKIGRMVNVVGKIETSGLGDLASQNGDIRLSLPFAIGNFDDFSEQFASPVMWYNSASMTSMNMLFWSGASNDSFCNLVNVSSTLVDTNIQGNAPGSSLEMKVSITYQAA